MAARLNRLVLALLGLLLLLAGAFVLLVGSGAAPGLITVDDRASISDLRHRIDEEAAPRLVSALDLPALDADLLVRPTGRSADGRPPVGL